jgi:hypothetical protein
MLAFCIAPLVAAFVYGAFTPAYAGLQNIYDRVFRTGMTYLLFGAYPSTLLIGIPAFLFLRTRLKVSLLNIALAGAFVATLPWLVLGLIATPNYSYDDGHVTAVDGHKTFWGWMDLAAGLGQVAAMGLLGGFVFWLIVAPPLRRPASSSA